MLRHLKLHSVAAFALLMFILMSARTYADPIAITVTAAGDQERWLHIGETSDITWTATVANAPQSTTEITITGPVWDWYGGSPSTLQKNESSATETVSWTTPGDYIVFASASVTYTSSMTGAIKGGPQTSAVTFHVCGPSTIPTTSVAAGATPSEAITNPCEAGLTYGEYVDINITSCKHGSVWFAVMTSMKGHYSEQTRLVPGQKEVTGPPPGGNSTAANYCDQVTELNHLGFCHGQWYILAAVVAHENVHAAHLGPALANVLPTIQAEVDKISVPDASGMTTATAVAAMKGTHAYRQAVKDAEDQWVTEVDFLASGDHYGPTDAAEHAVVDPMIQTICAYGTSQTWVACAACP